MVLRLYLDLLSQPCRALQIFCNINGIAHEVCVVKLMARQHRRKEFKAISPLGLLPAMDDDGFKLHESHAILKYLVATRPCQQTWYPSCVFARSRVDALLDWHHGNTRKGGAGTIFHEVLCLRLGVPPSPALASHYRAILQAAMRTMEEVWLADVDADNADSPQFLGGFSSPTLADLSIACELMQLELLPPPVRSALFCPHPKVCRWLESVRSACRPHFDTVHQTLMQAAGQGRQAGDGGSQQHERTDHQESRVVAGSKLSSRL